MRTGQALGRSHLLGFLVAHTSSTLMLKLFMDRGELHSPQARPALGVSITQDLSVVPMLLAAPLLAAGQWPTRGMFYWRARDDHTDAIPRRVMQGVEPWI